jgi:hypothetical protein
LFWILNDEDGSAITRAKDISGSRLISTGFIGGAEHAKVSFGVTFGDLRHHPPIKEFPCGKLNGCDMPVGSEGFSLRDLWHLGSIGFARTPTTN